MRYKNEINRFPVPDMSKISYGQSLIHPDYVTEKMTSAWKSKDIPERQRALVQQSLADMYRGKVSPEDQSLADSLRPYAYPGCSILEIGCASGYYYEILEYLLNKRISYTGVDYSEPLISMAKEYYPKAKFHVADGADLPFDDEQFYVVISSTILQHISDFKQHIRETVRTAQRYVVVHRMPVCRRRPTQYLKKFGYGVEMLQIFFNEAEILSEFKSNGLTLLNAFENSANPDQDFYNLDYIFKKDGQSIDISSRCGGIREPRSDEKGQPPLSVSQPTHVSIDVTKEGKYEQLSVPNFLIIGAEKSASTYVHACLKEHPEIFMPPDEISFFEDPEYSPNRIHEFTKLFDEIDTKKRAIGIKRPDYLGVWECSERIHRHLPDAKLIVILRDPMDRAISAYFHNMKMGLAPILDVNLGLTKIIDGEYADTYPRNDQIVEFGLYFKHLTHYLTFFDKNQMLIMLHNDFKKIGRAHV